MTAIALVFIDPFVFIMSGSQGHAFLIFHVIDHWSHHMAVGASINRLTIIEDMESYDFDPSVLKSRTDEFVVKHSQLMAKLQTMLTAQLAAEEMQAKQAEYERLKENERLKAENEARLIREHKIAEDAKAEDAKANEKEKEVELVKVDADIEKEAELPKEGGDDVEKEGGDDDKPKLEDDKKEE